MSSYFKCCGVTPLTSNQEKEHNAKHIRRGGDEAYTWLEIDAKRCSWHGHSLRSQGRYARRKFENLLVMHNPTERLKFIYINT